jgi:hypothetical protein
MFVPTKVLGVPRFGVTSVGLVDNTTLPEPVDVVTPVPPLATASVPVTPVVNGRPVQLVNVPLDGVPNTGVTKVGLVANTNAPEPVSFVTAAARLALDGVAKNVATPVPRPETPVAMGRPVQLVNVPDVGVPNIGVTRVGLVESTLLPEPVDVVTPVPPLVTPNVPVTPVDIGRPVALVSTNADGVPKAGVTRVGEVLKTLLPEPVDVVTPVPPLVTPNVPVTPVDSGRPVQLVSVPDVGVPSAGVVNAGLTARTTAPVPVAVVTPVPPEVTGSALINTASVAARVGVTTEVEYTAALVIFVPSLNTTADIVGGTATPVPVAFFIVTASAQSFCTMYCFSIAGTIKFLAPAVVPVKRSRRLRAVCVPLVSVNVRVTLALAKVTLADPVIASSSAVPRLTFVVEPHVPDCSPVVISSIFSGE